LSGVVALTTRVISAIWNGIQSAAAYVGDASVWLSNHLGLGKLQNQLAGTLRALASDMVSAFEALVYDVIVPAIDVLIQPIVTLVESGMSAYSSNLGAKLQSAWNTVNSTGSVTGSEEWAVGNAFGGTPLEVALGLGIAATIALTLLSPMDLGPSFFVGLVLGLVAGAVFASGFWNNGISTFGERTVFALENLANDSTVLPVSEWATVAGIIGLAAAGTEAPWSIYMMAQVFKTPGTVGLGADAAAVLAIDLIAIVCGATADARGITVLAVFAFTMAFLALVGVTIHFFSNVAALEDKALTNLGLVDVALSVCAMAGAGAYAGLDIGRM
jgi:hypothetical protein